MESQLTNAFYQMIQPYVQHFRKDVAAIFLSLALAWAAAPYEPRTSNLLRVIGSNLPSHPTTYYRFFSDSHWDTDDLALDLFAHLLQRYPDGPIQIRLNCDDTLLKKTGSQVFGAAMFRDAVLSTRAHVVKRWGLNWVVMVLAFPDPDLPHKIIPIPLMARLFLTKKQCREYDEQYQSPSQLAAEMLTRLRTLAPARIHIRNCADGAYTNGHLLKLELEGVTYTGRLRADARVQQPVETRERKKKGRPPTYGLPYGPLKEVVKDGKQKMQRVRFVGYSGQVTERKVIELYGTYKKCAGARRLRFLIVLPSRPNEELVCLVTTDLKSPLSVILEDFISRWCCEVCFREAKQDMGVESSQVFVEASVRRQVPFGLWLMGMIKAWYLEERSRLPSTRLPTSWYKPAAGTSFKQMRASLRYAMWKTLLGQKEQADAIFDQFGLPQDSQEKQDLILRLFCGC